MLRPTTYVNREGPRRGEVSRAPRTGDTPSEQWGTAAFPVDSSGAAAAGRPQGTRGRARQAARTPGTRACSVSRNEGILRPVEREAPPPADIRMRGTGAHAQRAHPRDAGGTEGTAKARYGVKPGVRLATRTAKSRVGDGYGPPVCDQPSRGVRTDQLDSGAKSLQKALETW